MGVLQFKLAMELKAADIEMPESSSARAQAKKTWSTTWKLPIKVKLKHFLWKLYKNWISVYSVLMKRKVKVEKNVCPRCGSEAESVEHLLFHCRETELVWRLAPVRVELFFSSRPSHPSPVPTITKALFSLIFF